MPDDDVTAPNDPEDAAERADPGARASAPGHRSYGLDADEEASLRRGAPPPPSRTGRRVLFRLLALVVVLAVLVGASLVYVRLSTRSHRYDADSVPASRVAIVFGAGLTPSGRPSAMLADRIRLAADLYDDKRVTRLLFTGDHGTKEYDELEVMRDRAVELGVSEDHITLDHAGFDTYDSCYRARVVFGVEEAVLVTTRFHLPRAVYTCRQLGVDAVGVGAADWSKYRDVMPRHEAREVVSTVKALWELHVTRPRPTFLGDEETID